MSNISVTATVGGKNFKINGFTSTGGCYGSAGHASIMTSNKLLVDAGIDIVAMSTMTPAAMEVDIYVSIDGVITRVFGGEYVSAEVDYDTDIFTIHARDWAGVLVDQKRVLTNIAGGSPTVLAPGQVPDVQGVNTQNPTLAAIVIGIAKQFGYDFDVNLMAQDKAGTNSNRIGALYGSDDATLMTVPQTLWSILNKLALDTGYDVYITPLRVLTFGLPGFSQGAPLPTIKLNYNTSTLPPGTLPCRGVRIIHNPRRNSTFRVLVLSYDAGAAQVTTGRATCIGSNLEGTGTQQLQQGIWFGTDAVTIDNIFIQNQIQVPIYTFHYEGLSQDQAQQKAQAIAMDISKREMILEATIDGLPTISPTQPITIQGSNINPIFSGNQFYVGSFTHKFSMPQSHHNSHDSGFNTTIKALNLPEPGIGLPVKTRST